MSLIQTPVSYGELIDKITILEIKSQRMRPGPPIPRRRPTSATSVRACSR